MRGLQHLVDSEPAMMDRRGFLTIATVGAAAALAGCAGDNTGEESITFEHPDEVQIDEDFEFLIDGLPENATIDITLEAELEDGEILSPMITLETADGRIDLADAEVISGESITEEDIWDDLDVPPTRALHQFIDKRYEFYTPPREQTITYHVESEDETLGSTSLTQTYPDLRNYERSEPGDLNGEVFEPPGDDPTPGVIVLHGSNGEPSSTPAALLAEHGFTVYALQYFSGPGLPPNIIEIPLEYVERAIEWLLDHDRVSGSRVGLYGFSKGAELALLAGSQFDSVGAVVSTSGSGVVWGGFTRTETPDTSSWSYQNEPVPYIPWDESELESVRTVWEAYERTFEIASPAEIADASIPVEQIDGRVLLISGGKDEVWNTVRFHDISEQRLVEHDHPDFEHLVYEDAGHVIRPPYYPVEGTFNKGSGGTAKGNAEAAHSHWPRLVETFEALDTQ